MGRPRIWITGAVLLLLVGAMAALNTWSMRPKPPPDVQLEGRLAPEPPTWPVSNTETPSEKTTEATETTNAQRAPSESEGSTAQAVQPPANEEEKKLVANAKGSLVKLETAKGNIYLELYDDKTPITVGNFLDLVASKFYNGLTFHRVIDGFMIQGGDPKGDGTGGPGFTIPDEADKGLKHLRGSLSMAKTPAPNSGGSQFFICHAPQPHLDGVHSVFGKCVKGMDVVDSIKVGDKINRAVILKKSPLADEVIEKAKKARVTDGSR